MSNTSEVVLLGLALCGLVYLIATLTIQELRERRERRHIDHLIAGAFEADAIPLPQQMERRLRAAGLAGPVEAYLFALSLFAVAVGYWVLQALPDVPVSALIAGLFAAYIPYTTVSEVARRRANRIEHQLTDTIDLTAGTLQAGSSLTQALVAAAGASRQPLRGELEEVIRRVGLSMPLDRAFARLGERYDSEGVRLFTLALAAKQQAGGELAPMLRSLNETLRDRWRQQRQVRAQLAGARLTAVVVVILPYAVAPVLAWLQPGWFDTLRRLPLGPAILFSAVMIQLVGALWIWRILRREL